MLLLLPANGPEKLSSTRVDRIIVKPRKFAVTGSDPASPVELTNRSGKRSRSAVALKGLAVVTRKRGLGRLNRGHKPALPLKALLP